MERARSEIAEFGTANTIGRARTAADDRNVGRNSGGINERPPAKGRFANHGSVSTGSVNTAQSSTTDTGPARELVGGLVWLDAQTAGGRDSTRTLGVGQTAGFGVGESEPENVTATARKTTATARRMTPFRIPSKLTLNAFVRIIAVLLRTEFGMFLRFPPR